MRRALLFAILLTTAAPAASQVVTTSLSGLAENPLVRIGITEAFRSPPDEANLTAGTRSRAPTASAAVAENKAKTEKLLAAIRAAGIRERDIQTQGVQLSPDYRYDQSPTGRGQTLVGYVASNNVRIKTRNIDGLTVLLDSLTEAGADTISGPHFGISDPAPLRRQARSKGLSRGAAEAAEYARQNGFASVRLLSVEEANSFNSTDIIVSSSSPGAVAPPPPPPPPPPGGGSVVAPGQIETSVRLTLLYRMER